jgi:peptide/nickel transport system substrate-binding protein
MAILFHVSLRPTPLLEPAMSRICRILTVFFACAALPAAAQELSIALSSPITSLDPHFHNLSPNNGMSKHFFDPLVKQDAQQNLRPGLAESWRALDDTTWEFKLRKVSGGTTAPNSRPTT